MNSPKKYLTKSRFKLAIECPTKLYYASQGSDYLDRNKDNDFLQALADGGYQIGELAKFKYHPDPIGAQITVESLKHDEALSATNTKLLTPGRVVVAEAALKYQNYFVRVDILIRDDTNRSVQLIEVKSKSIDSGTVEAGFKGVRGNYVPDWLPYLYDIAFQTEVAQKVFPGYVIQPKLLLINSDAVCDTNALHQKFKIVQRPSENGRPMMDVECPVGLTSKDLGSLSILTEVDVGSVVEDLRRRTIGNAPHAPAYANRDLFTYMEWSASLFERGERYFGGVSKLCKSCQFRASTDDPERSGVHECWESAIEKGQIAGAQNPKDRAIPLSIDIWGGGAGSKSIADVVIERHRAFLADVQEDDIRPKKIKQAKVMSALERRMAQVQGAKVGGAIYLNEPRLSEMDTWGWPLHMIDFETSAPAIPFFKGMHPYQTLAFQFSHHIMEKDKDGCVSIRHAHQWISTKAETFPSIEFVRELRRALMPNGFLEGMVFRYHNHENTVLRSLRRVIDAKRAEVQDADDLIRFIELITKPTGDEKGEEGEVEGDKAMVDLHRLVQEGYYSYKSGGSISLKYILPAILHDAPNTAAMYSKPGIYGVGLPLSSLNFAEAGGHVWLQAEKGNDPYKTLPKIFGGKNDELDMMLARLTGDEEVDGQSEGGAINQGGLAMTAYNYTQFASLDEADRQTIEKALLRYCELDTLAMVILVQGLMELRNKPLKVRLV